MSTVAPTNALAGLASQLTNPEDRETYAALLTYFDSLPEDDELCRLAQLLGFVTLMGQRVPAALEDFLTEFRSQSASSAEYHTKLEERLTQLPQEIAAGVDAAAIARAMSESFRQQLAATGLQDTAALLNASVNEIKCLTGEIAAALKPVPQQYKGIGATISAELARLQTASSQLQEHNARLIRREQQSSRLLKTLVLVVTFLAGVACGSGFW